MFKKCYQSPVAWALLGLVSGCERPTEPADEFPFRVIFAIGNYTARPIVPIDSVALAGVGCRRVLFASVVDSAGNVVIAQDVKFSSTHSGIVTFAGVTATGNYRGMLTEISGASPGSTLVIATYRLDGLSVVGDYKGTAIDTVEVTVAPAAPIKPSFQSDHTSGQC